MSQVQSAPPPSRTSQGQSRSRSQVYQPPPRPDLPVTLTNGHHQARPTSQEATPIEDLIVQSSSAPRLRSSKPDKSSDQSKRRWPGGSETKTDAQILSHRPQVGSEIKEKIQKLSTAPFKRDTKPSGGVVWLPRQRDKSKEEQKSKPRSRSKEPKDVPANADSLQKQLEEVSFKVSLS